MEKGGSKTEGLLGPVRSRKGSFKGPPPPVTLTRAPGRKENAHHQCCTLPLPNPRPGGVCVVTATTAGTSYKYIHLVLICFWHPWIRQFCHNTKKATSPRSPTRRIHLLSIPYLLPPRRISLPLFLLPRLTCWRQLGALQTVDVVLILRRQTVSPSPS